MEEEKLKSRIVGQAQVIFGGGVNVSLGTVGSRKDAFAIGLSELKYPATKAGEIPSKDDTWGVQVSLVFPDLDTLSNFRSMLYELEVELKEKIKAQEAQQSIDFDDVDPNHLVHQHEDKEAQDESQETESDT
jgi:hypothetical protein